MATQTLTQRQPDASAAAPVPIEVLAGGKPKSPVILALDLGQKTSSAPASHPPALNEQQAKVAAPAEWRSVPHWPEYEVSSRTCSSQATRWQPDCESRTRIAS